jgi:hypothetical protein
MYPKFCPECGSDLTTHASVTEVQEYYQQCHVDPDDPDRLFDEQKEVVGDCVRAFCDCGYEFYNDQDEIVLAFMLVCRAAADTWGLDPEYVEADFRQISRTTLQDEKRSRDEFAAESWQP